ncbi:MAG: hypothetical protein ACJARQ_000304 [Oleispira sp.]|jgi:hypothetical protein|tara:strand:- start:142 stop:795 length:654 start_codon:yes stop_codon:yes gene_type:complete
MMNTEALQQLIQKSVTEEQQTGELHQLLQQRLETVERIVQLPEIEALERLYEFVIRYIQQVPQMLEDLHQGAVEAGLLNYVSPILEVVEGFFMAPPKELNSDSGLVALMDEAFLAHRLFEEVNDTYIMRVGQPMIPFDMTMSNVIVHSLIGEPYANDLEQVVMVATKGIFGEEKAYEKNEKFLAFMDKKDNDNLIKIAQRWPCMSTQMGLDSHLQFA